MTEMEKRKERIRILNEKLGEKFEKLIINDRLCFKAYDGHIFTLDDIGGEDNAIVIEHAENIKDANNYLYEDGDLFYMDEQSEEEMFIEILKEIKVI